MANATDLERAVNFNFGTAFTARLPTAMPTAEDVKSKHDAVKIKATFLCARLAGSAQLARVCPWRTTAKIFRAFLDCSSTLIHGRDGRILWFGGDRVMAVFIGDARNSDAADCALEISYAVRKIIAAKAPTQFRCLRHNGITVEHAVGIDTGEVYAIRGGTQHKDDLIWIGEAPIMAAKLSECAEYPYSSFISSRVYNELRGSSKFYEGENKWEKCARQFSGVRQTVYCSSWWMEP